MDKKEMDIDERIKRVKAIYDHLETIIESAVNFLPQGKLNATAVSLIKKMLLGDDKLRKYLDDLASHRPPRLFLIGRTGVGKSSLINALCGYYCAPVSHVEACMPNDEPYPILDGSRVVMEICDSRGISESQSLDDTISAEQKVKERIKEFLPDVLMLVLNATHRDGVDEDIREVRAIVKDYEKTLKISLPVVVVINKCDEVSPAMEKLPKDYSERKLKNIENIKNYYKGIIHNNGLKVDEIVTVSSLIEWRTENGDDIESMPISEYSSLVIDRDGRYNIDKLLNVLTNVIQDEAAKSGLLLVTKFNQVLRRIADHFTNSFSTIAAAIVAIPTGIPVSDFYILLAIQGILVTIIAALNGEELSLESAIKLLTNMGGTVGAGLLFKNIAHIAFSFIPVFGDAVNAGIAFAGTQTIGKATAAYYIDGIADSINPDKVRKLFKKEKKKVDEETTEVSEDD